MSRRHLNTRWLPTNAHGQCPKCNLYGAGNTAQSIQKLANMSEKTTDSEILDYIRKYYRELEDM
jgi:hypothetical protein